MMRVLVVFGTIALVVIVICGAVIMTTRQQPLPGWLTLLHFDICKPPCWIGIKPGVTTLNEAAALMKISYPAPVYRILDSYSSLSNEKAFNILIKDKAAVTVTFRVSQQQIVDLMEFSFQEWRDFPGAAGTYADIHRFLGAPTYLTIQSWRGDTGITYPSENGKVNVVSWLSNNRTRWGWENSHLELRQISRLEFSRDEPLSLLGYAHLAWRGFLPLSKYKKMVCQDMGCH